MKFDDIDLLNQVEMEEALQELEEQRRNDEEDNL